jgi:hypothetical protein
MPRARAGEELGEQIALGVLVAAGDDLMAEGGVLVVAVVRAHPDERKPASGVVGQRHAVVGAVPQRFHERRVVGVAVWHHGVDRRGFSDQIEGALDAFVEDGVGSHLDAVEAASGDRGGHWRGRRTAPNARQSRDRRQFLDERPPIQDRVRKSFHV